MGAVQQIAAGSKGQQALQLPDAVSAASRDKARSAPVPGRVAARFGRPFATWNSAGRPRPAEMKGASMARHALGVLGVIAAGILLAVSAAMNYRFGFSLGKTALDGQIYGAASAAADCFKALVPFFFFAAIRNRMWSQAVGCGAGVDVVVVAYSMTSALGHAALNRLDTTGQRAVEAAAYKDLRADSKRAQEQLAWIPAHRPARNRCRRAQRAQGPALLGRDQGMHAGHGQERARLLPAVPQAQRRAGLRRSSRRSSRSRIAEIGAKLAQDGGRHGRWPRPIRRRACWPRSPGLDISTVQTALTIFVALLIEIGSGFGMYVAFAYWRLHDQQGRARVSAPRRPTPRRQAAPCRAAFVPDDVPRPQPRPTDEAPAVRPHRRRCAASMPTTTAAARARARQRRAALLPREGGCRCRRLEPHVDRALRGLLPLVRGEGEGYPSRIRGSRARSTSSASRRSGSASARATSASR